MFRGLRIGLAAAVLGTMLQFWTVAPAQAQLSTALQTQVEAVMALPADQIAAALEALIAANPGLAVDIAEAAVTINEDLAGVIAAAAVSAAPDQAVDIVLAIVAIATDSGADVIAAIESIPGVDPQVVASVDGAIVGGTPPSTGPSGTAENPATDDASPG